MPNWGTQDYKKAVFQELAGGSGKDEDHFQHFENFSQGAPRSDVEVGVRESFHPERVSPDEMEPQLRQAAERMQPHERSEVVHDLLAGLGLHGLTPSWLQRMLGLGSSDPAKVTPDDVAKLSEYSRQNHPEVFSRVIADKPFFVRWLNKPLVGAVVGAIAGKLLNRAYDR